MERNNIKIAKELVGLARELVAITMTRKDFKEYSKHYNDAFGSSPEEKLFDLFKNKKQLRSFLKNKKRQFPHLKEFLSQEKLKNLLSSKMMCVVSAGRNQNEIDDPNLITDKQVKERYGELRRFLESLRLPYYEVLGNYFGNQEISYIVDLTDDGKNLNNSAKVSNNLEKIRDFCHNQMKQDCIIEGVGKVTVFQYSGHYLLQDATKPSNDPYTEQEFGRSTVFTHSPSRYRRHNPSTIKDKTDSFSNNYDWDTEHPGTKY